MVWPGRSVHPILQRADSWIVRHLPRSVMMIPSPESMLIKCPVHSLSLPCMIFTCFQTINVGKWLTDEDTMLVNVFAVQVLNQSQLHVNSRNVAYAPQNLSNLFYNDTTITTSLSSSSSSSSSLPTLPSLLMILTLSPLLGTTGSRYSTLTLTFLSSSSRCSVHMLPWNSNL